MSANSRRGLHPIRDHADYLACVAELEAISFGNSSEEDNARYCRELVAVIDNYLAFTTPASKPEPYRMLCYLLTHVRPMSAEQAAGATGVADIRDLMLGNRDMTAGEVSKLATFFQVSEDVLID